MGYNQLFNTDLGLSGITAPQDSVHACLHPAPAIILSLAPHSCRRRFLLNYFGEPQQEPCGFCDNCHAGIVVEQNQNNQLFPINSISIHTNFGKECVMLCETVNNSQFTFLRNTT